MCWSLHCVILLMATASLYIYIISFLRGAQRIDIHSGYISDTVFSICAAGGKVSLNQANSNKSQTNCWGLCIILKAETDAIELQREKAEKIQTAVDTPQSTDGVGALIWRWAMCVRSGSSRSFPIRCMGRWQEGAGMSWTEAVGQMDLSCTDHISLFPAGDPRRGSEQAPRKNGVLLRPWHCAVPSLGLHPFP